MQSVLKDRFLSLNSHIFSSLLTSVSVANTRRAKPLTSAQHLNRNYQPKLSMYTGKRTLFNRRSQRKHVQAARMSFEPANLFTCDSNHYLSILLKVFTPKHFMSEPSTPGDSTLATLSVFQFILYFFGGTAHWLNRHRDSLEVTQDLPLITDQEYSSHCRRKIRALYAKVHLNLVKSTTVIQSCLRALVINWQLIDSLQFLLTESASSRKLSIIHFTNSL